MKKLASVLIAAAMIAVMTVCATAALEASFSLTGPASARAGKFCLSMHIVLSRECFAWP